MRGWVLGPGINSESEESVVDSVGSVLGVTLPKPIPPWNWGSEGWSRTKVVGTLTEIVGDDRRLRLRKSDSGDLHSGHAGVEVRGVPEVGRVGCTETTPKVQKKRCSGRDERETKTTEITTETNETDSVVGVLL